MVFMANVIININVVNYFMKFPKADAKNIQKHGAKLAIYPIVKGLQDAGIVKITVNGGHYEEFYHKKSNFIYYVISGNGKFYLNRKAITVKSGDLIVAHPNTKIYYLGKMQLLLITVPAWEEKYEHHVRDIPHD